MKKAHLGSMFVALAAALVLSVTTGTETASAQSAEQDRKALEAPYNATGGASWSDSTNWLSDEPSVRVSWAGAVDASRICGDVHGLAYHLVALIATWQRVTGKKLDIIVQVGDMGAYPRPDRMDESGRRHMRSTLPRPT